MILGFTYEQLILLLAFLIVLGFGYAKADDAWEAVERWRKGPPAKWTVRFYDQNGILTRTEVMSVKGVGRLIGDLDQGFYK